MPIIKKNYHQYSTFRRPTCYVPKLKKIYNIKVIDSLNFSFSLHTRVCVCVISLPPLLLLSLVSALIALLDPQIWCTDPLLSNQTPRQHNQIIFTTFIIKTNAVNIVLQSWPLGQVEIMILLLRQICDVATWDYVERG